MAIMVLGPEYPSESLCLLLPGAECTGDLYRNRCIGKIYGAVCYLGDYKDMNLLFPECIIQLLTLLIRCRSCDDGVAELLSEELKLCQILPDYEDRVVLVLLDDALGSLYLSWILCRDPVLPALRGKRVAYLILLGELQPYLMAVCCGDLA